MDTAVKMYTCSETWLFVYKDHLGNMEYVKGSVYIEVSFWLRYKAKEPQISGKVVFIFFRGGHCSRFYDTDNCFFKYLVILIMNIMITSIIKKII